MRPAKLVLGGCALLLAVAGCGGTQRQATYCEAPAAAPSQAAHTGGEELYAPAEPMATVAAESAEDQSRAVEPECIPRSEAPPYRVLAFEALPTSTPEVLLAELDMPPGAYFRPPTSSCQDVIILVRDGELEAVGTGIAPSHSPASLYPGDAVRFGPEGDGLLTNTSGASAHTIIAVARDAAHFQRTGDWNDLEAQGGDCSLRETSPVVSPLRVGSLSTTETLQVSPDLGIQIVLDGDQAGAENASLTMLHGTESYAIESHATAGSSEVLYIERGAGTMTIGDRQVAVHAGSALYIPRGVAHAFTPDGSGPLQAVQLYAPAGPEQRHRRH